MNENTQQPVEEQLQDVVTPTTSVVETVESEAISQQVEKSDNKENTEYVAKATAPFPNGQELKKQNQQYEAHQQQLSKKQRKELKKQEAAAAREEAKIKEAEQVTPEQKSIEQVKQATQNEAVKVEVETPVVKGAKPYIGAPLKIRSARLYKGLGIKFLKTISGTFYLFDDKANNGYIRITSNMNHAVNHTITGVIGTVAVADLEGQYDL